MTARDDEFDERVTRIEREVRAAREDAAAARILAGGADRDVAAMSATLKEHGALLRQHGAMLERHGTKLDVHKVLLDALRETQIEQGQRLFDQGQKIDSLEREMRRGFGMLATGQAQIVALLTRPDEPPPS